MRHLSIALAIALGAACAHGARADEWTGADKQQHAAAGMAIAAGVTALARDPLAGFVAGCGAGMAKELADAGRVFRAEASATTSSAGKLRSARICNISRPTLPVAPTTATL